MRTARRWLPSAARRRRRRSTGWFGRESPRLTSFRADEAAAAWVRETADRLRKEILREPEHDVGEEHREPDGDEEHDVERERPEHRPVERYSHELRRHQEREPVGRR